MTAQTTNIICSSCSSVITGKFCSNCGEKKITQKDFTVKHFLEESIEGLTHFDGKFFRSIKTLFKYPGHLTILFEQGKRVRYMKPLQLFIVCNLIFFLLVSSSNIFMIPLGNYYVNYEEYGFSHIIDQKVGPYTRFPVFAEIFNEKIASQSKAFIILFIPFLALFLFLFFFKKQKFFSLHLVFATHFFSFLLLSFTLFHYIIELPVQYFIKNYNQKFDNFATLFNISIFVLYFILAAKRYYKSNIVWIIFSAILLGFFFMFLLQAYRMLLFYKIIPTIHL
jgi:hypothetical protein